MAAILLFHYAQGLTEGITTFADELRSASHYVTVPDGRTFPTVEAGVAHAKSLGFESLAAAGVAAADGLPNEVVYGGFSLSVNPAAFPSPSSETPGPTG